MKHYRRQIRDKKRDKSVTKRDKSVTKRDKSVTKRDKKRDKKPGPQTVTPRTATDVQRLHSLLFQFYYEQHGKRKSIDVDYLIHILKENKVPYKLSEMKNWTGVYVSYNPVHSHRYKLYFTPRGLIAQPDAYFHGDIHEAIPRMKEDIIIVNSFFNNLFHPNFGLSEDVHLLKRIQNAFMGNEIAQEAKAKGVEPIAIELDNGEVVRLFWDESQGIELELETDTFEAQEVGSGNIQRNMKLMVEHDLTPLTELPDTLEKSLVIQEAMRDELRNARVQGGVTESMAFRAMEMEIANLLKNQNTFIENQGIFMKKVSPILELMVEKTSWWGKLLQFFSKSKE